MAKKAESETKLAVREETKLATTRNDLPDYLQNPAKEVRGGENVNKEDIVMPRLTLCSKQTPQFDENNEKHIPELKLGQFFNTITREIYGNKIYVVPLFELNTRSRWPEYGEGSGAPLCTSFDGKLGEGDPGGDCKVCPFSLWTEAKKGSKNEPPECTKYLNFVSLVMPRDARVANNIWNTAPRVDTLSVFGFKSTSYKNGQEWVTMIRLRNRDWFAGVYEVTSAAKSDGKNSWHVPVVANAGWLPKEGFLIAEPYYESARSLYQSGRMRVDEMEREDTTKTVTI